MLVGSPLSRNSVSEQLDVRLKSRTFSPKREHNLWKVYRRLADPRQPVSIIRQKYLDKTAACHSLDHSSAALEKKVAGRCKCYQNVIHYVRQVCCSSPTYLWDYRDRKQLPSGWMKKSEKRFTENEKLQFPLSTLVVRWQFKRPSSNQNYDLPFLRDIFNKHGNVTNLRMLSETSCLVVFDQLHSACNVVHSAYLGLPDNKLHCRWWHISMENKAVIKRHKGIVVKPIPFLQCQWM